jgi:hypothetical protein
VDAVCGVYYGGNDAGDVYARATRESLRDPKNPNLGWMPFILSDDLLNHPHLRKVTHLHKNFLGTFQGADLMQRNKVARELGVQTLDFKELAEDHHVPGERYTFSPMFYEMLAMVHTALGFYFWTDSCEILSPLLHSTAGVTALGHVRECPCKLLGCLTGCRHRCTYCVTQIKCAYTELPPGSAQSHFFSCRCVDCQRIQCLAVDEDALDDGELPCLQTVARRYNNIACCPAHLQIHRENMSADAKALTYCSTSGCTQARWGSRGSVKCQWHAKRADVASSTQRECPICMDRIAPLTSQALFDAHMLRHDSDFECRDCKRKHQDPWELQTHVLESHTTVLHCSMCGYRAPTRKGLKQHVMTHDKRIPAVRKPAVSGQRVRKPLVRSEAEMDLLLKCKLCPTLSPFSSSSNLRRHQQAIHEQRRDFVCAVCHKEFAQAGSLKVHVESMHEGVRYVCPVNDCDKSYRSKGGCTEHIRNMHGNDSSSLVPIRRTLAEQSKAL